MCTCPITIKNPYYGSDPSKGLNYLHDCENAYIQVPCGRCHECISSRQSSYSVRASVEVSHSVPFLLTLTYDNQHVPRFDKCGDVLDGFAYPDYHHLSLLFKKLRNKIERDTFFGSFFAPVEEFKLRHNGKTVKIPPFKYLAVAEYGKLHFRPHFHVLLFVRVPKGLQVGQNIPFQSWASTVENMLHSFFRDNFSINIGTRKNPKYESLYTFVRNGKYCTYDFHRIVPSEDKKDSSPIYYVTKYLYKPNKKFDDFSKLVYAKFKSGELSSDRFQLFYDVTHRLCRTSNYFGYPFSDAEYQCIMRSILHSMNMNLPAPQYIMPDGSTAVFPQCYKKFISLDAATHFAYNITTKDLTLYECYVDYEHRQQSVGEVERISQSIKTYDSGVDFLAGFSRDVYDGYLLRNDQSGCETTSAGFNNNDFGDNIESNFYQYRGTDKSQSVLSDCETEEGHPTVPEYESFEQLTLFDL